MQKNKNKLKNIMQAICFPSIIIALIILIVFVIIFLIKGYDLKLFTILGSIALGFGAVSLITFAILYPFVRKIDKANYQDFISQDFSMINTKDVSKLYPVVGFNEICVIQNDSIFFQLVKKKLMYNEIEIEILHKDFYGNHSNYFKIKVINPKRYKDFPKTIYLDYSKELMALFTSLNVNVSNIEDLEIKKEKKAKVKPLKSFHYPYKYLIIKIALALVLVACGTLAIIFGENDMMGYIFYLPIIWIFMNNSKSGRLYLTDDSVYQVKSFVKIEIKYDEIINMNINDKGLTISSPFTVIQFDNNEQIIEEIKKMIK